AHTAARLGSTRRAQGPLAPAWARGGRGETARVRLLSGTLHFLTPEAAVIAPAALVPAAAALLVSPRRRRSLGGAGLPPAPRAPGGGAASGAAAACALVIVAAAQPVLVRQTARDVRTDAELYVALDTSRSMGASASPGSASREDRAKRFAIALRSALPDIPA